MDDFKISVKKSFSACKEDINFVKRENLEIKNKLNLLKENNDHLKFENSKLKEIIEDQKNQINEVKTDLKAIKIAMDYIKDLSKSKISDEFENINLKKKSNFSSNLESIKPSFKDPYEALLAFKAKANKRELLKKKLLSIVGEAGMSLSELKFMFVDQFKYTSKATFYNYLKELELERNIRIERENSKNYVYLSPLVKEV
jgi:chromosome segregation ATPase